MSSLKPLIDSPTTGLRKCVSSGSEAAMAVPCVSTKEEGRRSKGSRGIAESVDLFSSLEFGLGIIAAWPASPSKQLEMAES
jgi:hypothetical protein